MKKVYAVMYMIYSSRRDVLESLWENKALAEAELERLKAECLADEFGESNYMFYIRPYDVK